MSSSIIEIIAHYQRSIEKSPNDEARLLHCIEKLYKLPVTVDHLQQTGIGKTVNSLRKYDKEVGVAAKALVAKWKAMVAAEEEIMEEEAQKQNYDDDHQQDDNNSNSYNGNQQNTYPSENSRHNHNRKDSSRHEKNRDINENERGKYKENRGESRDKQQQQQHHHTQHSRHSSSSDRKLNKANDRHNYDQKADEKHKRIKEISTDRKSNRLPKPEVESSPEDDDSDGQASDDDDEDDEKLVIDINKEKLEEEIKQMSRESHKISKSSRSSSSSEKHHKESSSNHHSSSKRHKTTDEKNKKDSTKKSSSSNKSHSSSSKTISKDNIHHQQNHTDNKDTDKSSSRSNGEHKSSSSKRRGNEKPKIKDEKRSSKSSSKRKRDSTEDSNPESEPEQKTTPKKIKSSNKIVTDGIDSSMGSFSFEEALGMIAGPSTNSKSTPKLKSPKSNETNTNQSASSSVFLAPTPISGTSKRSKTPPLLTSKVKLEPLDPKIAFELPTISPNYKPMPLNPIVMDCVFSANNNKPQRRLMTDEEALCAGISSKTIRTKIYSGVRTGAILQVPTLFDLCIRVLQKNIDALEYTGGVPFEVLKPVLERATPEQLLTFEDFNPYLMEDTDELWKHHCGRRYKSKKREELESWREMFLRCKEELEERLSAITKTINYSQKQSSLPIRKTQMAYVDVTVKPPRNVQRQQEQYGTKSKLSATPAARVAALSKMTPTIAKAGDTRLRVAADVRDFAQATSSMRPKKAPLMQKTLQLMKGRFKR